jgi:hypothetical protein
VLVLVLVLQKPLQQGEMEEKQSQGVGQVAAASWEVQQQEVTGEPHTPGSSRAIMRGWSSYRAAAPDPYQQQRKKMWRQRHHCYVTTYLA